MHQYPLWKSMTVLAVVLVSIVLALPNVFGETAALQLSRKDRAAFAEASVQELEQLLERERIAYEDAYLDADGRLWIRFGDVERQIEARDLIAREYEGQFAIATTFAPRAPRWLTGLGLKPMSLGLDLRGGIYLVYEVDVEGAVAQLTQVLERDLRKVLRDARIPYDEVAAAGPAVRLIIKDPAQTSGAVDAVRKFDPQLAVRQGDLPGQVVVELTPDQIRQRQDFAIQQNITALNNRVNALGVAEPVIQRQGLNRIAVQLPGIQDAAEVVRVLGKVATLEFRLVDQANSPLEAKRTGRAPLGTRLYDDRQGNPVLLKREVIATGEQLIDATSTLSQGEPAVDVVLDGRGGEEMLRTTRENLGKPMAVVFIERERELVERDGRKVVIDRSSEEVISVATIRGIFSNRFQITGLTASEGQELARLLRAGALAAPLYIVEQRLIGPSLGRDNIERGFRALVIGMLITFVFMALYYRVFGLVADVILVTNVVLITALLSLFGAALTLPGIAGIVLTVGMAVDANILIYERIREEVRNGNSPWAAIHGGFEHALSAIIDANVTTLIAAVMLFAFGTGPIRGFAVVLFLGILTSLFTALMGSRALIQLVYGRRRRLERLAI
ncbi:MAG: preprotein translocase subunit SecD [Gammaproteobacteria bacterium SG8_30]|jgi:preprotein translocase subunit SecD|nr:MAG: preprotein translocase subunit SecD [Gammaproteobacteria bacterium SG8_30]